MNTEYIGDEKGTYPHVESGAVHIDGSTERQDERHDVPFYSKVEMANQIKDLKEKNDKMQAENKEMRSELDELKAQVAALAAKK